MSLSEYQYLHQYAYWRYRYKLEKLALGLCKQSLRAFQNGELDKALCLQFLALSQQEKILLEWMRMEEIVNWLELDSELRNLGSSYPDFVERD